MSLNNLTDAISNLAAGIFAPLYSGGAIEAEADKATSTQQDRTTFSPWRQLRVIISPHTQHGGGSFFSQKDNTDRINLTWHDQRRDIALFYV